MNFFIFIFFLGGVFFQHLLFVIYLLSEIKNKINNLKYIIYL